MAAMQNPSTGSPVPVTSFHNSVTTESINAERSRMAAFPSPESSKCFRMRAVSSAYRSCSVEVWLSSLITDQPSHAPAPAPKGPRNPNTPRFPCSYRNRERALTSPEFETPPVSCAGSTFARTAPSGREGEPARIKSGQSAGLQCGNSTLLVPNPNRLIDFGNEDFSIADLSRRCALENRVDCGRSEER